LPTKTLYTFLSSSMRATYPAHHSPWFYLPNDIWGWVQIMKLLFVQFLPFSSHFIPLWSKYSPQYPALKHLSLCTLFPQCVRSSFTPIQNKWQYYVFFIYLAFTFLDSVAQSVQCLTTGWTTGRSRFDPRQKRNDFSSNLCVQTGSGAHPASCTMGTGGSFPRR
jgi:hypothetical protein